MLDYSASVIKTYATKATDGTLNAGKAFGEAEDDNDEQLIVPGQGDNICVRDTDTQTKGVADYRRVVETPEVWDEFNRTRLEPCFDHDENLFPFETVESDAGVFADGDNDDLAFERNEKHIAPDQIIKLGLKKIHQQFPSAGETEFGDSDIRRRISAGTRVFYHNYKLLNNKRHDGVADGLAWFGNLYGAVVCALVAVLFVLVMSQQDEPAILSIGWPELARLVRWCVAYADELTIALVTGFAAIVVLAIVVPLGLARWIEHRRKIHFDRFWASTSVSSATVTKAVILRQETLVNNMGAMLEQTNQGREEAWEAGRQKEWTAQTRKWGKLIFWIYNRISANQEFLRIHMKLIGMMYVGLRARARLRAWWLIVSRMFLLTMWLQLGVSVCLAAGALTTNTGRPMIDPSVVAAGLAVLIGLYIYLAWRMRALHQPISGVDTPMSINAVVKATSTPHMKGTRHARLDEAVAAYITREKLRLQMEERKHGH